MLGIVNKCARIVDSGDIPASDPLSSRVIHIMFSVASDGSSIIDLPISMALLLNVVTKKESSRLGLSMMMT